ncbi:MAG: hypothetical protein ACR2KK_08500 [Acidimicrobiales bacterium]
MATTPLVAVAFDATKPVLVVFADRELGGRCRAAGAQVVGPSWLHARTGDQPQTPPSDRL